MAEAKRNKKRFVKFVYLLLFVHQFFGIVCIIMDSNCDKQEKILYWLSPVGAVSAFFLHVRKWTYTSTQRLQGRGKILKTFGYIMLIFHVFYNYYWIYNSKNVIIMYSL
jgi:hypothetical protein